MRPLKRQDCIWRLWSCSRCQRKGEGGVETTLWLCSMREIASFRDIRALEQMSGASEAFFSSQPRSLSHLTLFPCPSCPYPLAYAFQVSFQCRRIGFLVRNYNVIVLFCDWLILPFTFKRVLLLNWIWDENSSWCFCVQWAWLVRRGLSFSSLFPSPEKLPRYSKWPLALRRVSCLISSSSANLCSSYSISPSAWRR